MKISFELQNEEIGTVFKEDEKPWLDELYSMGLKTIPRPNPECVEIAPDSPFIFYKEFSSLEEFISWMRKTPLNLISMWQEHACDFVIQTTYLG